jgi:hypothetical protein
MTRRGDPDTFEWIARVFPNHWKESEGCKRRSAEEDAVRCKRFGDEKVEANDEARKTKTAPCEERSPRSFGATSG